MARRRSGVPTVGGVQTLLEPGVWQRLRLAWRLFRDPRVAPRLKLTIPALGALYLLSPIDVVPDLFVGIGQVDDLGILGLLVLLTTQVLPRLAPPDVVAQHLAAMGLADPPQTARSTRADDRVVDASFTVRE